MMDNYKNSLERKRKIFNEKFEAFDDLKNKVETEEKLQDLVYEHKRIELLGILNTSGHIFDKLVKEWGIKLPPKGYWKMMKYDNTYEDFKSFFKESSQITNSILYSAFPDRPRSTVRRWKNKLLKELGEK
jgi:hypothetical protein